MGLAERHKESNSKDIPTLVDCGCIAIVWNDESGVEIEYCSLHKSAQKMLDALKAILGSYKESSPRLYDLIVGAEQALAQAGKE
jgi:hypothetical protein